MKLPITARFNIAEIVDHYKRKTSIDTVAMTESLIDLIEEFEELPNHARFEIADIIDKHKQRFTTIDTAAITESLLTLIETYNEDFRSTEQ